MINFRRLFDNFLCFSESGIIASSSSRLKVYNYRFKIYWDNNLYKNRTWHKHELSCREKNNIKQACRSATFLRHSNTGVFCEICETFKNSGGYFWKHVTYYVIENYVGHKLVIFKAVLLFIVNPIIRHETKACGVTLRGTSRQQKHVPETKRSIAHAVLYW